MRVHRSTIHWPMIFVAGVLTSIGLVNLFSALHLWGAGSYLKLFWLQLVWIFIGSIVALAVTRYDYRLLLRSTNYLVVATLILLGLVLLVGKVIGGNRNWLGVGGMGIQPSEFAKIVVVLLFAKHFTDAASPKGYKIGELFKPIGSLLLITGAVALGGDMGTTLFISLIGASMVAIAGLKWKSTLVVVLLACSAATVGYFTVLTPVQRARVTTFLHPEDDPRGKGYHVMQSRIAIGSGKVWGRGYMKGTVNKLRYLPERHTDFIFPVLAEEWGFAGCVVTVLCYLLLITFGCEVAVGAGTRFGSFLAAGIVFWLFWQVAINLGGVLGLMPLTGVTLPFLSYGGSSMIVAFAAIGLLLSIHRRRHLF